MNRRDEILYFIDYLKEEAQKIRKYIHQNKEDYKVDKEELSGSIEKDAPLNSFIEDENNRIEYTDKNKKKETIILL
ncbi:MAG: hypothetical protein KatS3mg002_0455 [Candidatus Woesearchaeota archaeon]|nr:MAG: hypothetical protein KatS3mg002_0455 [Candidatus Woesearchaeota archaeon]